MKNQLMYGLFCMSGAGLCIALGVSVRASEECTKNLSVMEEEAVAAAPWWPRIRMPLAIGGGYQELRMKGRRKNEVKVAVLVQAAAVYLYPIALNAADTAVLKGSMRLEKDRAAALLPDEYAWVELCITEDVSFYVPASVHRAGCPFFASDIVTTPRKPARMTLQEKLARQKVVVDDESLCAATCALLCYFCFSRALYIPYNSTFFCPGSIGDAALLDVVVRSLLDREYAAIVVRNAYASLGADTFEKIQGGQCRSMARLASLFAAWRWSDAARVLEVLDCLVHVCPERNRKLREEIADLRAYVVSLQEAHEKKCVSESIPRAVVKEKKIKVMMPPQRCRGEDDVWRW